MSVSIASCAALIFIDTMTAVPSPVREQIWGNYHERRKWMRYGSYGLLVGLLQASTKGINPIKLACFNSAQSAGADGASRYDQTLLPPIDDCSLVGGRQLNAWLQKHSASMAQAMHMFQMDLYRVSEYKPIGTLFKIFQW